MNKRLTLLTNVHAGLKREDTNTANELVTVETYHNPNCEL